MTPLDPATDPSDVTAIEQQLGRTPRGIAAIGHRCPCGSPDVVTTEPRLPNGTPFPTTYYLTCPRAASRIGTLEGSGLMKEMETRLGSDPELAAAYRAAHEAYLVDRNELARSVGQQVPEIEGISAGGMPDRVKCLHVLAAHALAAGPGVNPLGDEVLEELGEWWAPGPCIDRPPGSSVDPIAAIDCGTNTIKLFIGRPPMATVRETRMVRLGQGVDATGELAEEALARTFAAIDEFAELIRRHGVPAGRVRFCATSATRDATNAEVFRRGVIARLGVAPEVLSGDDEAAIGFAGAMNALPADLATPVLVIDIGGGSTEVILGDRSGVIAARSMDVGSVRLHERHVHSDPPSTAEVAAVVADVDAHLDGCGVPFEEAATVVGIAGTMTTLAAAVLDLPAYDPDAVHGSAHDRADVLATVSRIVAMTVEQRRVLPYLHPGRADVIDAGLLIAERVLRRTGVDQLVVSEADILEGIAWTMA